MAREHGPQERQDALVGEYRLPGRLDPARRRACKILAELLAEHPFPRIELEDEIDGLLVLIDEGAARRAADVFHRKLGRLQAGLACDVFHVGDRAAVLGILERAREMQVRTL